MLVDSGLTHNFVVEEIVKKLGLAVQYSPSFGVQIGKDEIIKCNKVCHDLSIEVSNLVVKHDFFLYSFGRPRYSVGYIMDGIPEYNTSQLE